MQTKDSSTKDQGIPLLRLLSRSEGSLCIEYLDPVIAATYGDDGTLQEVCRALAPKLQEANVIVRPHCYCSAL